MIFDTAAIVAVVFEEPHINRILDHILAIPTRRISAANLLEAYMVTDRSDRLEARIRVNLVVAKTRTVIEPVTADQVVIAREAFRRFGKGSGHPARLNFGDCFAYALARFYNEPLLFVGGDFAATDIESAMPASNP